MTLLFIQSTHICTRSHTVITWKDKMYLLSFLLVRLLKKKPPCIMVIPDLASGNNLYHQVPVAGPADPHRLDLGVRDSPLSESILAANCPRSRNLGGVSITWEPFFAPSSPPLAKGIV